MKIVQIAVFASGEGTNFRRLVESERADELGCGHIALLVSDKPHSGAVSYAREMGIATFAHTHKELLGKEQWELAVLEEMQKRTIDLIVLAGYMRIIGTKVIEAYTKRMINLHPSLLPAFKGLDAIGQALAAQVKETGVTIHYVDADLDAGPIIAQQRVPMEPSDTYEQVARRIQRVEHELLPRVVKQWCEKETR